MRVFRREGHQCAAQQAGRGLPVPELRPVAPHDRVPEHQLWPGKYEVAQGPHPQKGG